MKDETLLRLLQTDPDAGMDRLVRQYGGFVFAVVKGRLDGVCDSAEIEDCAADVFLDFYQHSGDFRQAASLKNYLCVMARNRAVDCFRKKRPTLSLDGGDFPVAIPDGSDLSAEAAEKQVREAVWAEIRRMPPPDCDILFRKYYLGERAEKIAADLKLTVSDVDTRAHRAVRKLKQKFGGEGS